ncbi:MAG: VWA domain-containing protein [Anaerolineales bacterium]|nr:VWA domain-containing protein [Anaerolineales bacterium]
MYSKKRMLPIVLKLMLLFSVLIAGALVISPPEIAQSSNAGPMTSDNLPGVVPLFEKTAACSGSAPVVEGPVTLSNCYTHNFSVNGNARTISVWYSLVMTAVTVDGETYSHWIANAAQAQAVAEAAEAAWQRYFTDSGHEPYLVGCDSNLNIQMRDGKGWSGIAYWASSGKCNIGIDAPDINGGVGDGDRRVIAHEVQHFLQYSYNNGCYADFKPMYPGDSEYVEGYADVGMNSVPGYGDAGYNMMGAYNNLSSMYDKSYGNSFLAYFTQQLGTLGAPADTYYHVDPMYQHYEECDVQDDLYVIDDVIQSLSGGSKDQKWFFVDFFAANYAHSYANASTQPELVYSDNDDVPTSGPTYSQDVNLSSGSQNWTESTPDDWAARYYRIRPQTGCDFVMLDVETVPAGGEVGINLMATRTSSPTQVLRSAHIGDKATRFFAGAGANDELIVVVNSFNTASTTYDVTATCVVPTINILEPTQNPGHAMVGAPDSPIATLTRFEVTGSGSLAVSGITSSQITFNAEGDAPTLVANSFQEVGPGEYWAVINPPVKPVGTTWVDYQVCLQGSICDSETDAFLYVNPGNSDIALLFDESGSMVTEDTPGEGTRVDNAKKAGKVIPDLLRDDDRILVIGFGAKDDPAGCGLPPDGTGTGNCPPDHKEHLARTDVTVPATITAAKNAVDLVSARPLWTNIGDALREAKNKLLANPGNTNPDYIFLLSDGRENVLPKYEDVKAELQASGVHINTIGFGPEAPGSLLAQIAAENSGIYRPVATNGLGTTALSSSIPVEALTALGVSEELAEPFSIAAVAAMPFLPGPLGLADAYDYFDTDAQDAARIFHVNFVGKPINNETWWESSAQVDESVSILRFVVAGKQEDGALNLIRRVEILPPGADPQQGWIPVSPQDPGNLPPTSWQIRHSAYDDVVIIPQPDKGLWKIHTMYYCLRCGISVSDFMINGSVQSTVRLEGRLLGLDQGQARSGDTVPIVATLMTRNGTIPGALVGAFVENEGGEDFVWLLDDGMHNDGQAGDGIYGWPYSLTAHGGSYGVRIIAAFFDPANPAAVLVREWNGGFWILGPQEVGQDLDKDGMPDDWERRCDLDTKSNDSQEDPDRDGLINFDELNLGTSPCQPDTDRGGELDGSEVSGQRNPLWPDDDLVLPIGHVELRPLDQQVWVNWNKPLSYTRMLVYVSTSPDQLGRPIDMGQTGTYIVPNLVNGQTYYFILQGEINGAKGAYSDQYMAIPKEDPVPPQGAFQIGGPNVSDGGDTALSRNVTLLIDATDQLNYEGPASHSVSHDLVNPQFEGLLQASDNIEMRFSNDPSIISSVSWEPLAETKPWTVDCGVGETCIVYGQFRDGAMNESLIILDNIILGGESIYLPILYR